MVVKEFFQFVWSIVALCVWAVFKTVQVAALRAAGRTASANRIQERADADFRWLCGVPEPGEGWDW